MPPGVSVGVLRYEDWLEGSRGCPHVRIGGGAGEVTSLVYPTESGLDSRILQNKLRVHRWLIEERQRRVRARGFLPHKDRRPGFRLLRLQTLFIHYQHSKCATVGFIGFGVERCQ